MEGEEFVEVASVCCLGMAALYMVLGLGLAVSGHALPGLAVFGFGLLGAVALGREYLGDPRNRASGR